MRLGVLILMLFSVAAPARAEWQLKPFLGLKFGGDTNLVVNLDQAEADKKTTLGIGVVELGEIFGVEADVGHTPGYLTKNAAGGEVIKSALTTLSGNIIVALPRRMSEYTLRPYFVGGVGLMHLTTTFVLGGVFDNTHNLPALVLGGGATGFISDQIGVSWDLRRFRSFQGSTADPASTVGGLSQQLSFWRANMALAIRF
jgi:hypothetical protein